MKFQLQEIDNLSISGKIHFAHDIRRRIMTAICRADRTSALEAQIYFSHLMKMPELGIMDRSGDRLRSLKNFMISYNSFYSYSAEEGGLSPLISHYKAERYAIMIERANSEEEVHQIYLDYFEDYLDGSSRTLASVSHSISERVVEYINKNFTNNLSIDEIAKMLHLNASYLMRCFKKETSQTIQNAITEKRVRESCRLLANSNLSLTEISMMVGFNSSSYFSRIFKQEIGVSPKTYREHVKKSLYL